MAVAKWSTGVVLENATTAAWKENRRRKQHSVPQHPCGYKWSHAGLPRALPSVNASAVTLTNAEGGLKGVNNLAELARRSKKSADVVNQMQPVDVTAT